MKSDRGMITLMTVFSGIASLMCLLVGLQLLTLESQIRQAVSQGSAGADIPFTRWQTEVHTGAIMALGAGVLILLFGIRHHYTARKSGGKRSPEDMSSAMGSAIELDSLSVRVFEVDQEDRSVEITSAADTVPEPDDKQPKIVWHPLEDSPHQVSRPVGDPADSIVQSIQDSVWPGSAPNQSPQAGRHPGRSFLDRIIRRRGRR